MTIDSLHYNGSNTVYLLPDDSKLLLRAMRPSDKPRLLVGFKRLSQRSRRQRCLAAKKELSAKELQFLTEFDGYNHFALGALILNDAYQESDSVGGARFIRDQHSATVAEFALTVLDHWQQLGIGKLLLKNLIEAAKACGVRHLSCDLLPDNHGMRRLLLNSGLGLDVRIIQQDGLLTARFRIADDLLGSGPPAAPLAKKLP